MPDEYAILAAVFGCAVLPGLLHPDVRRALLDGLRCMGRYPDLWKIPAACGIAYALFQTVATALLMMRNREDFGDILAMPNPALRDVPIPAIDAVNLSLLPAIESLAGIFNTFALTFPLSALAAVYFLCNAGGMFGEFTRAIRRRLPRLGWPVIAGFVLCAGCAVAKPVAYLMLPEIHGALSALPGVVVAALINAGSYFFEFVFGVCLQIYLMLMAFAWIRGIRIDRERLLHFAVRRLGIVIKWSFVLLLLITTAITVPLLLELALPAETLPFSAFAWADHFGRPLVAGVMILFCGVQITLVFHSERLGLGIRDGLRFAFRNAAAILIFLKFGLAPFLLLGVTGRWLSAAASNALVVVELWRVMHFVIQAGVAGWLIAAWVCLYRSRTSGRKELLF